MNAKMKVSEEFLINALYLPDDTHIIGASIEHGYGNRSTIILIVNHPEISTDDVFPMFEAEYDKQGNKIVRFVSW